MVKRMASQLAAVLQCAGQIVGRCNLSDFRFGAKDSERYKVRCPGAVCVENSRPTFNADLGASSKVNEIIGTGVLTDTIRRQTLSANARRAFPVARAISSVDCICHFLVEPM